MNEKQSLESKSKDDEEDVDGAGCDYNEGWGDVPKKAMSEAEVARMCRVLSDSGVEISEPIYIPVYAQAQATLDSNSRVDFPSVPQTCVVLSETPVTDCSKRETCLTALSMSEF